jgi:S1-C subfamily serine protease/Flp pilus assembly protein TadD
MRPSRITSPSAGNAATHRQRRLWVAAATALAVACFLSSSGCTSSREPERLSAAASSPLPPDELFARASPAVVQVVIQNRKGRSLGGGSGFLIGKNGFIVTNYHVIEKAHKAQVVLADKSTLPVLGAAALDEEADLAILKVAGQIGAQPLELAGNDLPPVGTKVYAIGSPLGLTQTLSDGLVSGHREIDDVAVIQTTAPISPGSSGGPLLGTAGRVVGVTTAFLKGGQNLNFAVPASHVARLLLRCAAEGQLTRFPLVRHSEAVACIERGRALFRRHDFDNAIKEFNEAIQIDPKNAIAYKHRGDAWWDGKFDFDRAIQDYNQAIRLDPDEADTYYRRGRAHKGRGNFWRARDKYEKAKDEYEMAIQDYSQAIRLDPTHAFYYSFRGGAWREIKAYGNALKDYEEAIHLDPSEDIFYTEIAEILATCPEKRFRDGNRAIQMATKACELSEWEDHFALQSLAAAYAETGHFDKAEYYERKALDVAPEGLRDDYRLKLYKQKKPYREAP